MTTPFESMLLRKAAAPNGVAIPTRPSADEYTSGTLKSVLRYVREHSKATHTKIVAVAQDRDGQTRRREALQYLVSVGALSKSAKRPWTYTIKEQETQHVQA